MPKCNGNNVDLVQFIDVFGMNIFAIRVNSQHIIIIITLIENMIQLRLHYLQRHFCDCSLVVCKCDY